MAFKKTSIVEDKDKTKHEYHLEIDGKDCKFVIQEPDFDQIAMAMSSITTMNGSMNLPVAGRFIWDTCCIGYDEEVRANDMRFVSVCLNIATNHVVPAEAEIKKK